MEMVNMQAVTETENTEHEIYVLEKVGYVLKKGDNTSITNVFNAGICRLIEKNHICTITIWLKESLDEDVIITKYSTQHHGCLDINGVHINGVHIMIAKPAHLLGNTDKNINHGITTSIYRRGYHSYVHYTNRREHMIFYALRSELHDKASLCLREYDKNKINKLLEKNKEIVKAYKEWAIWDSRLYRPILFEYQYNTILALDENKFSIDESQLALGESQLSAIEMEAIASWTHMLGQAVEMLKNKFK